MNTCATLQHRVLVLSCFCLVLFGIASKVQAQAPVIDNTRKELLLSLPLMSDKSVDIMLSSLRDFAGVTKLEACYELQVVIIAYDAERIDSEERLLSIIRSLELNSPIELKNAADIPKIRSAYEITVHPIQPTTAR